MVELLSHSLGEASDSLKLLAARIIIVVVIVHRISVGSLLIPLLLGCGTIRACLLLSFFFLVAVSGCEASLQCASTAAPLLPLLHRLGGVFGQCFELTNTYLWLTFVNTELFGLSAAFGPYSLCWCETNVTEVLTELHLLLLCLLIVLTGVENVRLVRDWMDLLSDHALLGLPWDAAHTENLRSCTLKFHHVQLNQHLLLVGDDWLQTLNQWS